MQHTKTCLITLGLYLPTNNYRVLYFQFEFSDIFNIGPRNEFLGFSTRSGFLVSSGFLGFLAKSDKIWVSEALQFFAAFYYQFTDDTKFHDTETAVVMISILLLFHLFRTTSAFSLWH